LEKANGMWGVREIHAVFLKELRTEWRTKVALSSTALFAIGGVTLAALALRGNPPLALDDPSRASVAAGLLWILLFFTGATGLGRAFALEEERGTALALRLTARASAVWIGKFLANALLILGLAIIATPMLITALDAGRNVNALLLTCVVASGCIGIAATMTFAGALVAQASAKSGLLATLSLPALAPLFVAAIHGTRAALGVGTRLGIAPAFQTGMGDLQVLASYAVISVTAALMLFDYLWND
jgi:heme exporter protein B